MDQIISIVREQGELIALINRPNTAFQNNSGIYSDEELSHWYDVSRHPLSSLEKGLTKKYQHLMESWESLKSLTSWNAETLYHVWVILIETVPAFLPSGRVLKKLQFAYDPPEKRPTAGHPRAFKGTTFKPPKEKVFSFPDLRPYLCDGKYLPQLFKMLYPFFDDALEMLSKKGYETHGLSSIGPDKWDSTDLYFLYHHKMSKDISAFKLPERFVCYILPSLKKQSWNRVLEVLKIYWGGLLHQNTFLLNAVSRLLSLNPGSNSLKWCHLLMGFPLSRQAMVMTLLMELKVYLSDPSPYTISDMEAFQAITPNQYYQIRLYAFLQGIKENISAGYLLNGFQLSNTYDIGYKFEDTLYESSSFPYQRFVKIVQYVEYTDEYYRSWALMIWRSCSLLRGFSEILSSFAYGNFSPKITILYLNFLAYAIDRWALDFEEIQERWTDFKNRIESIERQLRITPTDYQEKFIHQLDNFTTFWNDAWEMKIYFPMAFRFACKLSYPPFSKNLHETTEVISDFIDRSDALIQKKIFNAPNSSFISLEKACRSKNQAKLIAYGMSTMITKDPNFTANCFLYFPKKLFSTAKVMGTLSHMQRLPVLKVFAQHPLNMLRITPVDIKETVKVIESNMSPKMHNPIPKKLKAYSKDRLELSEERIHRYLKKMKKNLYALQLEILKVMVSKALKKHYPTPEKADRNWEHTVEVMNFIDNNRRGFKRFIKAYGKGNTTYLFTHPRTKEWMDAHPVIDIHRWTQGIETSHVTKKYGKITLQLEKDPLEALKLGTYAGTCLGIGGDFTYSAVAVVLDINKQVVYARNEKNQVIARQLLGISEEEQLVCFNVYPDDEDTELVPLFKTFDLRFAKALKITPYQNKEEDYTIQNILSQDWWDDMAWDLTLP